MAEEDAVAAKKPRLSHDDLVNMSREELVQKCQDLEEQMCNLLAKQSGAENDDELVSLRESEEKMKQQQLEAARRENVLVMRLTSKEQEMQEYLNQINEFKQTASGSSAQLRSMLLDPAINLMFQRMKREMELAKEKMEQAQNDMAAWKFTPDSQTGKRLMNKCRNLLQENEELGRVIDAGRTAKLEGEIALKTNFVEEMKKSQAETDDFLVEMDEDVEGMQSTIYLLQQQLKEAKDTIARLQHDNSQLRSQAPQQTESSSPVQSAGEQRTSIEGSPPLSPPSHTSSPHDSRHNGPQSPSSCSDTSEHAEQNLSDLTDPQYADNNHTSHSPHRTLCDDAPLSFDGTDMSSEDWSPARSVTSCDDAQLSEPQSHTKGEVGSVTGPVTNGLVTAAQP